MAAQRRTPKVQTSESTTEEADESKGVIRVNVSVPRELKARMEKVTLDVNWSAVATEAFETKLWEIESANREMATMKDVVKRMKAAAELENKVEYQRGFKVGKLWASTEATPKQLRRLDAYIQGYANESVNWFDLDHFGWPGPLGATGVFALQVLGVRQEDADRDADRVFWAQALGDDADRIGDQDFFQGFGEGALDVWEKVESQL